jgi:hypothetical protein
MPRSWRLSPDLRRSRALANRSLGNCAACGACVAATIEFSIESTRKQGALRLPASGIGAMSTVQGAVSQVKRPCAKDAAVPRQTQPRASRMRSVRFDDHD